MLLFAASHGGDHLSRAADHALLVGIVLAVAAVGALVYGLVRLVGRKRDQ